SDGLLSAHNVGLKRPRSKIRQKQFWEANRSGFLSTLAIPTARQSPRVARRIGLARRRTNLLDGARCLPPYPEVFASTRLEIPTADPIFWPRCCAASISIADGSQWIRRSLFFSATILTADPVRAECLIFCYSGDGTTRRSFCAVITKPLCS